MSFGRLFALFLIVPVVDLALLVTVGERLGFWLTVGLVVATALAGSWLARREGLSAWRRVQASLVGGAQPGEAVLDGLVILMAGTLLLTPGFITDVVGLLGLFPPSRRLFRAALARRFRGALQRGTIRTATFGTGAPPRSGAFGPAAFGSPPFGSAGVEDAEVLSDEAPPRPAAPGRETA